MRKSDFMRLFLCLAVALFELPLMAQGVIVWKKDGTQVKFPYEEIDSIVTYNVDKDVEEDEPVTPPATTCEAVDLGLSVKWASCNVGAESPEDYGGYYAWGETEEKNNYGATTYKYFRDLDGDGDYYDDGANWINIGSNISGTSYDVAHVKWGGSWRMPTKDEFRELSENCSWEWTSVNGVSGQKVTGPNGNSIFLPAAGGREGSEVLHRGSYGFYWSGTLLEDDSDYAYDLNFNSGGYGWGYGSRDYGPTIRPVTE